MAQEKNITKRDDDFSQWYLDVVEAADMAEHSPVRGCMVIKPYGYAIWENIRDILDRMIKATGHVNAYFPLFIPKSFLSKEASHVEGFAKECAVVTHYRLKNDPDGKGVVVDPEAKLEEELIVRPTSETIMYSMYAKWIQSWRDLPVLINQWANVVRWEMRTRLFLRTAEFLWQEGHTAHATHDEAETETLKMLDVYKDLAENYLALSLVPGQKSESEKFAGALRTYTIEAMMQDGKALQAGTSHNLGQNFAKAFEVMFADKDGERKHVWQTSWGLSTRIMGGLIMTHSDDKGLVLPPKIAPTQVVIVPIYKTPEEQASVLSVAQEIEQGLKAKQILAKTDNRDFLTPGAKFNEWEKKGVPVRIEIGPKDIASGKAVFVRRDTGTKQAIEISPLAEVIEKQLQQMQIDLFEKAKAYRKAKTFHIDSYEEFKKVIEETPGFIYSYWCGSEKCEAEIAEETKASTRCIPFDQTEGSGKCIKCGRAAEKKIIFAKAY